MKYPLFRQNFHHDAIVKFAPFNADSFSDRIVQNMNLVFTILIDLDDLFQPGPEIDSNCATVIISRLKRHMRNNCVTNNDLNDLEKWKSVGEAIDYIFADITVVMKCDSYNWIVNSATNMMKLQENIETAAMLKQCQKDLKRNVDPFCQLSFEIISRNICVTEPVDIFDPHVVNYYLRRSGNGRTDSDHNSETEIDNERDGNSGSGIYHEEDQEDA